MARGSLYGRAQTFKAGEDLSEARFLFMKISAEDTIITQDTANAYCVGVLQMNTPVNQEARIRVEGTSLLVAGGTVAVGNFVASDTAGKGVVVTPTKDGTTTLHAIRGVAMSDGVGDETIEILLVDLLGSS